ncbi:hypothetical protein [Actinomadura rugatobispora]|uniref:MFS transporter n=1 Tax=Actinomadura rugatobispora TaxID=1994 RepID=A0ABW0ZS46_9ACTN|nr:hypothetical protein GCM10010200_001440 [Actinomadura rugatobispora]
MELWSAVRVVRAAAFSVTCAGLAAVGHLAGGGKVAPSLLTAGFVLMFVPALMLTRRERTIGEILPAVAICEVGLHLLLSRCCAPQGTAAAADAAASHGTAVHDADGSSGFGMLLMHAVAVLITSWWLEQGEAALCSFVRCVAAWALRTLVWLRPPAPYGAAPSRPFFWQRHPVPARVLRHVMARRGPPARRIALV